MNKKRLNMSDLEKEMALVDLEKEMALVETYAVIEEQYNADQNYTSLDNELKEIVSQIPYPQTEKFTTGIDYEDREKIQFEKSCNVPYWKKQAELEKYCKNGSLYKGHLRLNGTDYYFMENSFVNTKIIENNNNDVWLINVDDRVYGRFVKLWRYPSEDNNVKFSRNITMQNRRVSDVDIVLDKGNEFFSNISDAYLRKALVRNKSKSTAQSIIQTIQKKQDAIRSLPKEKSFVVQGCAGSGKTMVLLHRLRYLLHNKDFNNGEYVFLVPSNGFKEFINEISTDFNINEKNILPFQEYYQDILGKKSKNTGFDTSELVFAPEYLEKVYSKTFMKEAYKGLFDIFLKQTETLISFCAEKLNGLLEYEKLLLETEIDRAKETAIETALEVVKKVECFTTVKIENSYDNIHFIIEEIEESYSQRKKEYEIASNPDLNITISQDDERLLSNERLMEIRERINAESHAIEKASFFTLFSHKNKLKKLQKAYEIVYEEIVGKLIEEDKEKHSKEASRFAFVYENVSLAEVEIILGKLKSIIATANSNIYKAKTTLDNINEYFGEKFSVEIEQLNKLIVVSGEVSNLRKNYVDNLMPAHVFFEENILLGVELLNRFNAYITTDKDKDFVKTELVLFAKRTQNQLYAYLNMLLFNSCKREIVNEYGIKICEVYKHYWYIALYCKFLTRPIKTTEKSFIFIDEAQDLSVSEIELINKVNSITNTPTINLFGDINQMITTHGVKDWSQLQIISDVYTLDENFRNTNQIVDYCNKNLTIQMVKIGVDMEEVSEYNTIIDAIVGSSSVLNNAVFIVKDDYCVSDLKNLLDKTKITNYEVYTVKAAKGLEFKEIFVFDADMSLNEKYISYTRALAKLNVIKSLPQTTDRRTSFIIQDNEPDDVSEEENDMLKL